MSTDATRAASAVGGRWSGLGGQTGLLAAGYLVRSVGALALTVLLGRLLGPEGFGQVTVFLAVSWGAFYIAASWVLVSIPALSPGREGAALDGQVFWSALLLGLGGTLLATTVLLAVLVAAGGGVERVLPRSTWPAVAITALALLVLNALYAALQALKRAGGVALLQALERFFALALAAVTVLALGGGVNGAVWALAAAAVATALLGALGSGVRERVGRPAVTRVALRRATRFSGPLAVSNVAAYLVAWVDILILAAFLEPAEVGVYSVAYQFFALLLGLAGVWVLAAVPDYVQRRRDSPVQLRIGPLTNASALWSAVVAVGGTAAVAMFGVLFGDEFRSGAGVAAVLLAAAALLAPYFAVVPVLIAAGRTRALMWISVGGAATNVIVDLALVQSLGIWAAAIGTVAQTVLVTAAIVLLEFGGRALAQVGMAVLPGVAALAVLAADPHSAVATALAGCVACFALVATGLRFRRTLA